MSRKPQEILEVFCTPMNPQNSNSTPVIEPGTSRHGVIIMVLSVLAFTVNTLLLRYLGEGLEKVEPYLPLFFRAVVGIFIVLVFFRGRRPTRIRPVFRDRTLILRGLCGLLGTAAYYWTVPTLGGRQGHFALQYLCNFCLHHRDAFARRETHRSAIFLARALVRRHRSPRRATCQGGGIRGRME